MAEISDAVLVVGYGNPLRGDDGVSERVLEALREAPEGLSLELQQVHQLAPELSEVVARHWGVVFVDARAQGTPGEVRCEAVTPGEGRAALSHSVSPDTLLLYAEHLYGRAPVAAVVTVGGRSFGHGRALSPEVARAIPAAVERVLECAREWTRGPVAQQQPRSVGL